MSSIGHNSGGVSGDRLKTIIARIEKLESEKSNITESIKDVYAEAKGDGFDTPTIRKIVRLRRVDEQKRREDQELLDLYISALNM